MPSPVNGTNDMVGREQHIPINSSIYYDGTTIKAIMELKFNPGEGVAHLSSADKG
jgi:hypothetical protein